MKAIISTTYNDTYLYFLPITTWCWNKLGIGVICFFPNRQSAYKDRLALAIDTCTRVGDFHIETFNCPEDKEATYAQCSRLYAACLNLPEDEVIFISDIDMANFQVPPHMEDCFTIFGYDLVPANQYPACYISATVKDWRAAFGLNGKTPQQCLDGLLGDIQCENMRSNYWAKDQEEAYNKISIATAQGINLVPRTNGQNQFATHRVDRDDTYWRDRISELLVDAHLWRPGYDEQNHNNLIELLGRAYPGEDFQWLIDYRNEYLKLL